MLLVMHSDADIIKQLTISLAAMDAEFEDAANW